jgi:hypothetical protein
MIKDNPCIHLQWVMYISNDNSFKNKNNQCWILSMKEKSLQLSKGDSQYSYSWQWSKGSSEKTNRNCTKMVKITVNFKKKPPCNISINDVSIMVYISSNISLIHPALYICPDVPWQVSTLKLEVKCQSLLFRKKISLSN